MLLYVCITRYPQYITAICISKLIYFVKSGLVLQHNEDGCYGCCLTQLNRDPYKVIIKSTPNIVIPFNVDLRVSRNTLSNVS